MNDVHSHDPLQLYNEKKDTIEANRKKYEHKSKINVLIRNIEKTNETKSEESDDEEDYIDEDTTPDDERQMHEAEAGARFDKQQAMKNLPKEDANDIYLTIEDLTQRVRGLNPQQRRIFDDIIEQLADPDIANTPFYLYLAGEAGTGKSYLVQTIIPAVKHINKKSGKNELEKPSVLVIAPTANAAFLIGGKTIDSALAIHMEKTQFNELTAAKASQMAFNYEEISLIICDEISMVGTNKFFQMNRIWQRLKHKPHDFMASTSFISVGDFRQLPPVKDKYVFETATCDGRSAIAPNYWTENMQIYYLDQKMRCPDDIDFAKLCDRVGKGDITPEDEEYLRSRVREQAIPEELENENFTKGKIAIIVTTNDKKDEINLNKLRQLLPEDEEFVCLANDKITENKGYLNPRNWSKEVKSGGMVKNLIIRKGAPVVMTVNHSKKEYKEDGLVNGAKGFIDYIETSQDDPKKVKIIWIVFRNNKIGSRVYKRHTYHLRSHTENDKQSRIHPRALPILPIRKKCEVSDGNTHFVRAQWALSLAYALTSHKCQGDTLEKVIVDFTPNSKNKTNNHYGMFYVAITRVTNKDNLFLRSFDRRHIQHNPRVEYEIETMRRTKQFKMKKIYCDQEIFTEEDMKIGYLNLNGLLAAGHAEYINEDPNLLCLDLLAIGETHLCPNISNATLQRKLTNWKVFAHLRQDSSIGNKHMGILVLGSRKSKLLQNYNLENGEALEQYIPSLGTINISAAQGLKCRLGEHTFAFIYSIRALNQTKAQELANETFEIDYLLGDLNLNTANPTHRRTIDVICGKFKKMLLTELTTKHSNQLDHILGKNKNNVKVFTTAFLNLASDHKAIVIRISKPGADFITLNNLTNSSTICITEQDRNVSIEEDEDEIVVRLLKTL